HWVAVMQSKWLTTIEDDWKKDVASKLWLVTNCFSDGCYSERRSNSHRSHTEFLRHNSMSERSRISLLLAPAMAVIVVLFVGGLLLGLGQSLNYLPLIGLTQPNLDAYVRVFTSEAFIRSF